MENQTCYDLNGAIENWRQELAAQANLTADVRLELETHLRDAIAGFQKRGIDDEEAFWLARRRVGRPQRIDEEFVKANPALVWRTRILWMAAANLVVSLWILGVNQILQFAFASNPVKASARRFWLSNAFQDAFGMLLRFAPIVIFVFLLLHGRGRIFALLGSWFRSRSRVIYTALGWLALDEILILRLFQWRDASLYGIYESISVWANLSWVMHTSVWPLALICLIGWLMKPEDGQVASRA